MPVLAARCLIYTRLGGFVKAVACGRLRAACPAKPSRAMAVAADQVEAAVVSRCSAVSNVGSHTQGLISAVKQDVERAAEALTQQAVRQRERLTERQSRRPDLVVISPLSGRRRKYVVVLFRRPVSGWVRVR